VAVRLRVVVLAPERLAALEEQRRGVAKMSQYENNNPDESDDGYHPSTCLIFAGSFIVVFDYGDETCSNAEKNKDGMTNNGPFAPASCTRHGSQANHDNE